ncbi:MAG: hypothetical protein HRU41_41110 [Saprospiraceae bacterium]|nr:hypothetical protein [Saprospiraceae bacterium]
MNQHRIASPIFLTFLGNIPLCKMLFQQDYSPYFYWITLPFSLGIVLNLISDHPQPAQLENTGEEDLPLPVFSFLITWETDHTTAEENAPLIVEASNVVEARRNFRELIHGAYIVEVIKIEEDVEAIDQTHPLLQD